MNNPCVYIATVAVIFTTTSVTHVTGKLGLQVKKSRSLRFAEKVDPEVYMDATQLITSKGYPCENHYVTTDDGYILNIIRIPFGLKNTTVEGPRPTVIVQHGVLTSSVNFLENLANQSLAFILADRGIDVWLPNSRGTSYSRKHKTLDPNYNQFWDFSYDEMAKYDLPAVVKYVVSKSGVDQLYYIGHSQGTTIAFIAFGENQEVASHIKHFIAMAPVARVGHNKTPLSALAFMSLYIKTFLDVVGHGELKVPKGLLRNLAENFCSNKGSILCSNLFFLFGGFSQGSFNMSRVSVYVAHNPDGTSSKNVDHWIQGVNSKEFRRYDYGYSLNRYRYGTAVPPRYEPSKVKVPVSLFYGGGDLLVEPEDRNWLFPQLNVANEFYLEKYTHFDYVYGMDAPQLVYDHILKIILA